MGLMKNYYRSEELFALDSGRPGSLTLPDYSKVVARYKRTPFK